VTARLVTAAKMAAAHAACSAHQRRKQNPLVSGFPVIESPVTLLSEILEGVQKHADSGKRSCRISWCVSAAESTT